MRMRALEMLRAHIEHKETDAWPNVPEGAVTLQEVDQAIAEECFAAVKERVAGLQARAQARGVTKKERARRLAQLPLNGLERLFVGKGTHVLLQPRQLLDDVGWNQIRARGHWMDSRNQMHKRGNPSAGTSRDPPILRAPPSAR